MINVLTGNKKLLSSFLGQRVGSVSRTPIKSCPGAPKGGCVFSGKRCYCLRIGKMYYSVRKHWRDMDALGPRLWRSVGESIDRQRVTVFRPFSDSERDRRPPDPYPLNRHARRVKAARRRRDAKRFVREMREAAGPDSGAESGETPGAQS